MTDPASQPRLRARNLVGEFLLIVVGVSVALAANSWWGMRQDHIRENEYVVQLRADLAENQRRLGLAIELEEIQGAAARAAAEAVFAGEPITVDSARAWLVERRGLFYSDPRLLTGTFSGIVQSGDLRLIRDPATRNAIIAYVPQIAADQAEFDRWVGLYQSRLGALRAVGLGARIYDSSPGGTSVQALITDPSNPAVLGALDAAVQANENRLTYLHRILAATDAVAEVISRD